MLQQILSIIIALIFLAVSAFHYYWVFGGKLGLDVAFPKIPSTGKKIVVPGKIMTFVAATLFLMIAILFIASIFQTMFSNYKLYFFYTIAIVTLIRAIGDFKYVGFFKQKNNTAFAVYDTKYFSPLCITISLFTFGILFL